MEYKRSGNTLIMRLDRGDEITESLIEIAKREKIKAGHFSAIGASDSLEIGVFDPKTKEYSVKKIEKDCKIASLVGNFSTMQDKEYVHAHIVVASKDLKTVGGHLIKGIISLTCEIFITVLDCELNRKRNEDVGINTFCFD